MFDLVGITGATTQTGINAGLSMFTWFCQIAAVYVGKRVGRKTILLWVWPTLLLGLIGLCASGGVFEKADEGSTQAGVATVVLVWVYLGCFNFASESPTAHPGTFDPFLRQHSPRCLAREIDADLSDPVLYSYPAEVQTYSMRSKGLLVWNTVTQLESAYVIFVDAVALDSIGYKYYAVYMPLVIIQWFMVWRCG